MRAGGGAIIAILAWLGLGLALTFVLWALSRWLGKVTAARKRGGLHQAAVTKTHFGTSHGFGFHNEADL